jgi:hypothetical protein
MAKNEILTIFMKIHLDDVESFQVKYLIEFCG